MRDRDPVRSLGRPERQHPVVESLLLALPLALADLGGQVVRVVLGKRGQGGEDHLADWGGEVHRLGDGDEAHAG